MIIYCWTIDYTILKTWILSSNKWFTWVPLSDFYIFGLNWKNGLFCFFCCSSWCYWSVRFVEMVLISYSKSWFDLSVQIQLPKWDYPFSTAKKKFSEVFRNHDTFLAPHGHFKVFVVNESLVDSSEIWSEEPCWHLVKNCQTANTMTHLTAFKPKHILCGAKFDDFCNMEILRGAVFDELFPYS